VNDQSADIIISGGGLAGLSLAVRLSDPAYHHLKILVIDKSAKQVNDRTWSFWSRPEDDRFQHIYHKSWKKIAFHSDEADIRSDSAPYSYNTIKGIDFYKYSLEVIERSPNITFIQADITSVNESEQEAQVHTREATYTAKYIYDSIVKRMPVEEDLFVWQHFLGWEIEMSEDTFDDEVATFMDFRIDQGDDTRFVYVLPFSKQKALVEATVFSKDLWEEAAYEKILKNYIQKYYGQAYNVISRELGKIPMTTATFAKATKRIIPIGSNAATVKPSSGYAFTRIQHESDVIASQIAEGEHKPVLPSAKYLAYDKTLLHVLLNKKESAAHVFSLMFKRNKVAQNLKFLDEDTSLLEEMKIFSTLPFWSFLKAFTAENVLPKSKIKKIRQP